MEATKSISTPGAIDNVFKISCGLQFDVRFLRDDELVLIYKFANLWGYKAWLVICVEKQLQTFNEI